MEKIDSFAVAEFYSPGGLTMAEAIERIGANDQLSPTRKRDLSSSLKRACYLLGREPTLLHADISILKSGFATLHPA